ncbi:exosortase family protein XrtF [Wenyingzhuangia heitensis]|uniref:Exosortase family protein XrtF n=1 Tax=Wenyingzhuangia heitensis TaxID=1487859 RepID=A0ABX0UDE1_9FLAO|nr:exosortase family protein XrtF [Wenyingzhuangia heitensis]NIJ45850.1 exosortase family protein XrtF [Wenyingzhuangia heitensis]
MKNKKIWWFLFRFLGTYFFFFLLYSIFLMNTQTKEPVFICDPLTIDVAEQSKNILNIFDQGVVLVPDVDELSVNMLIDGDYVVGIIEGCNSVSIIILFVAFIIAFQGSWKATILFSVLGALSIYYVNILRIVVLTYGMYHYPEYTWLFHDLVFPAIIYGYIFVLWIVWVNYFSNLKNTKHG